MFPVKQPLQISFVGAVCSVAKCKDQPKYSQNPNAKQQVMSVCQRLRHPGLVQQSMQTKITVCTCIYMSLGISSSTNLVKILDIIVDIMQRLEG